jgi:hypothetical protein
MRVNYLQRATNYWASEPREIHSRRSTRRMCLVRRAVAHQSRDHRAIIRVLEARDRMVNTQHLPCSSTRQIL